MNNNSQKKVSIIIPAYNSKKLLKTTLFSAIRQTYKKIEIIVVDDGSTDGTYHSIQKILKKYKRIIKYIKQENRGLPSARNRGMDLATGDYFFFLDSDDLLLKNGLQKLVKKIQEDKADAVVCNWKNFGKGMRPEYQKPGNVFPDDTIASLMKKPMVGSAILIKKTKTRFNRKLKTSELFDFFFRFFLTNYRISYLDFCVVKIRQHNSPNRLTNKINHYDPSINLPLYAKIKEKYAKSKKLTPKRQAVLEERILSRIYFAHLTKYKEWPQYAKHITRNKLPSFYWFKITGLSGICWIFGVFVGVRIFSAVNKIIGRGLAK